eukprot:g82648.t1
MDEAVQLQAVAEAKEGSHGSQALVEWLEITLPEGALPCQVHSSWNAGQDCEDDAATLHPHRRASCPVETELVIYAQ